MENLDEELSFKGGNPGAVQYGNFINYYQFHPPENRIKLLPKGIWSKNGLFVALDIGSNAGDLTVSIYDFLTGETQNCEILGIDIDPTLVQRSKEKIQNNNNIKFECLDFMNEENRKVIKDYLKRKKLTKFDAIFCFSVTMWIHLNYGDDGLKLFLREICELGDLIVLEPQPWKCYRTAVKRMKLSNAQFPLFKELKIRQDVTNIIEKYVLENCSKIKTYESDLSEWSRKLLIFKNYTDT